MNQEFQAWTPSARSAKLLVKVNEVLEFYRAQGYRLTLRQLYYQLVARGLVPNTVRSYKSVGDLVGRGRMAGLIDWEMIEDRVRVPSANQHWGSEAELVAAAANAFKVDRWAGQKEYVELWCEKDAVSNILEPVCREWDVVFLANRGYGSLSALYAAAGRFHAAVEEGRTCRLLYFGDHDPSGLDMTRDVEDRLVVFLGCDAGVLSVQRVALNMDQVEQYHPPENPAKDTDSRYAGYVEKFGESSWELDALEPSVLEALAREHIEDWVDQEAFDRTGRRQERGRKKIRELARGMA